MFRRQSKQPASEIRAHVAELYESHFERVARYIAVRIGNIDDAEDLSAEVFVRALRSADSFTPTGAPLEAWIFKIARNIAIDYLRQKGRRPRHTPIEDAYALASNDDPTERIGRAEEIQHLHRAMERLTEAQRQVLSLRFGAEMTSEQVAQVLGRSPGAVREMQSAAIKRMRQLLSAPEKL